MDSLYHAYQCYEQKAARGEFCTRQSPRAPRLADSLECLLADLGDGLIRLGTKLKRRCELKQTLSGSPALGKLDR